MNIAGFPRLSSSFAEAFLSKDLDECPMKSFSPVERLEDRSINSSCFDSFVFPFISLFEIEGQREEINKGISRANKLSHASPYAPGISAMLPLSSELLLIGYSGPT